MTILIIIAALIAFAYIFGKRPARILVLGSGALVLGVIIIGLLVALGYFLWTSPETSDAVQGTVGVFIVFFVVGILSLVNEHYKKLSLHKQKYIKEWIQGIIAILVLGSIIYWGSSTPKNQIQQDVDFTRSSPYEYIVKDGANVRSCGSFDCNIVGYYDAGVKLYFNQEPVDLPEWNSISWIDDSGVTQYGFINKSTVELSIFEF